MQLLMRLSLLFVRKLLVVARSVLALAIFGVGGFYAHQSELRAESNPLVNYINAGDDSFSWRQVGDLEGFAKLELRSQTWRGIPWTHNVLFLEGQSRKVSQPTLIFLSGGVAKSEDLKVIRRVSELSGISTALITNIPNQPLFGDRREDALLAYTFEQYARTGELDWPVIFPMVKSIVRGMDAISQFTAGRVAEFAVSGASKRGWISYLVAAVDARVVGIAPRVFDMLNMNEQSRWQREVYGSYSHKLKEYSELGLLDKIISDPKVAELTKWVDPYSYRERLKIPKLVLLGTNDPYWVVDSQRFYWNELPGPKALVQFPNKGHSLGEDAFPPISIWVRHLGAKKQLPELSWKIREGHKTVTYDVQFSANPRAAKLWFACSQIRDMRGAEWSNKVLSLTQGRSMLSVPLPQPKTGYCAYYVALDFEGAGTGDILNLSTEVFVVGDKRES
jgi:PhoPQ-activated pathogenicity-related protein